MHAPPASSDLARYVDDTTRAAQEAARCLAAETAETKDRFLHAAAQLVRSQTAALLAANERDISRSSEFGLSAAAVDRLRLNPDRLEAMARALEQIAQAQDPVGEIIEGGRRPNGLLIQRVRVPLGVVFFIYESRPNVTVDAAAICIKSGNAVILRGGKEAFYSNQALHKVLREALVQSGLPAAAAQLVETTDREAVGHFLKSSDRIDVTIPRGGKSLIERVTAEARMPVIKHYDGICHVYVDRAADVEMAQQIIVNSKCQRPGVCNAAECLLVHRDIAEGFLPTALADLSARGVELRCCERSLKFAPQGRKATDEDYRTEYLDFILSVKVVDDFDGAIAHIAAYGSRHTDAIVTDDLRAAQRFVALVDSAAVMVNASTRFHDGGEFGFGAEIGISTDKFHARGPCGLRELTTYKFIVQGSGQVRS
jgi:glutamate-5-semialdehyde dehydrogenase